MSEHTTEENFEHFLNYSNVLSHFPATEAELIAWLRYAYFDGAGDPASVWPLAARDAAVKAAAPPHTTAAVLARFGVALPAATETEYNMACAIAVFANLREEKPKVTDEMVERAAVAMYEDAAQILGQWKHATATTREHYRNLARRGLEAAMPAVPQAGARA